MKENRAVLKRQSMARIRDIRNRIIMVTAVFLLLSYLISMVVYKLTGYSDYISEYYKMVQDAMNGGELTELAYPHVQAVAFILAAALLILNMVLDGGYEGYCLLGSRSRKAGVKNLFDGFSFFSRLFLLKLVNSVLQGLLIVACYLLLIPTILFSLSVLLNVDLISYLNSFLESYLTIPLGTVLTVYYVAAAGLGILALCLMYTYSMSIFIMYDNPDMNAWKCLRASRRLVKGKKIELFVLDFSLTGWFILDAIIAAILLPIVQLFLQPYRRLIRAGYYNQYIGYVPPREVPGENGPHE